MFQTPVLLLIFNRPGHTQRVFDRIREMGPTRFFVAADGPRDSNLPDVENCQKTRQVVLDGINWDCEFKTLFRDENLGCGMGVSSAIDWFFENVEEGIILEDDCLPDKSFFPFCENLLRIHRANERIMHISGNNFLNGKVKTQKPYYFSIYNHVWGWASWRDRWEKYKFSIEPYDPSALNPQYSAWKFKPREVDYWNDTFKRLVYDKSLDTWCYQWTYAIWKNNGVCILPATNLVMNIGFDQTATHTRVASANIRGQKIGSVSVDGHHLSIEINRKADIYTFDHHFKEQASFFSVAKGRVKALLSKTASIVRPFLFWRTYRKFRKFTMIPEKTFIRNLELARKFRNTQGVVVECGTWRGGMIAGMVSVLGRNKAYYLFDSFEGLPEAKEIDGPEAKFWQSNKEGLFYFDNCRANESEAAKAMDLAGAHRYTIKKGWFNTTLSDFRPSEGISILRLDGDWYDSTMECLTRLFPQVNANGVVIIDDYYMWRGCSKAVHDYLSKQELPFRISVFKGICYISKS